METSSYYINFQVLLMDLYLVSVLSVLTKILGKILEKLILGFAKDKVVHLLSLRLPMIFLK